MKWQRGLFRLWIVLSAFWIVGSVQPPALLRLWRPPAAFELPFNFQRDAARSPIRVGFPFYLGGQFDHSSDSFGSRRQINLAASPVGYSAQKIL